jgi:hypothetical protein
MISDKTIKKIMDLLFLSPQRILGGEEGDRKLDTVHLVSIKLLSGTPVKGRGCKIDPILIKIGFSGIDEENDICEMKEDQIRKVLDNLKRFDEAIGSWTLVHDIPATKERPQWRMSAEVSPKFIRNGKIEETEEENSRKVFCFDLEGVGIFFGKPAKEEKE